jgi:hypothetical protein
MSATSTPIQKRSREEIEKWILDVTPPTLINFPPLPGFDH